jgi:hypothetical protein
MRIVGIFALTKRTLGYQKGVRPVEIFRPCSDADLVPRHVCPSVRPPCHAAVCGIDSSPLLGVYLTAAANKYWRMVGVSSDDGLALGPCKSYFVDACI